jgi:hypothetical protein
VRLQAGLIRYYVASLLPMVLAMALGSLAVEFFVFGSQDLGWSLFGVTGGAVVGTTIAALIRSSKAWIQLSGDELNLPGGGFDTRLIVPVGLVDRARTSHRNWLQKLGGEQLVWLQSGERSILNHRWFRPGELKAFLLEAGCA